MTAQEYQARNPAYPHRVSPRDRDGYDAGSIHAARRLVPGGPPDGPHAADFLTACGRTIGQYGTVPHDIGPTCKRCKAAVR